MYAKNTSTLSKPQSANMLEDQQPFPSHHLLARMTTCLTLQANMVASKRLLVSCVTQFLIIARLFSACSSKSSVHEFSRFADEDRDQGSRIRDDSYDLLIEAICNVITTRLTEDDLHKLKAPLTHYANIFVESIARDLGESDLLSTILVEHEEHGSGENDPTRSTTRASKPNFSASQESGQGLHSEQNNPDEGFSNDAGSLHSMAREEHQIAQNIRTDEPALSCPYRKRNPIRFNIRSHSSCALSHFPSITLLKWVITAVFSTAYANLTLHRRHIKAFHSKSGEQCRRCWAWFETAEDLFDHMTQSVACELRRSQNRDSEDGVSPASLQKICDKRVQTWNEMWLILFPDSDRDVPQPGEPLFDH